MSSKVCESQTKLPEYFNKKKTFSYITKTKKKKLGNRSNSKITKSKKNKS